MLGLVSDDIVYAWIGICIVYIWSGVSLYNLCFLVYVYFIYIGVSLYHLRLDWCQSISSTFGYVSVYIVYA